MQSGALLTEAGFRYEKGSKFLLPDVFIFW